MRTNKGIARGRQKEASKIMSIFTYDSTNCIQRGTSLVVTRVNINVKLVTETEKNYAIFPDREIKKMIRRYSSEAMPCSVLKHFYDVKCGELRERSRTNGPNRANRSDQLAYVLKKIKKDYSFNPDINDCYFGFCVDAARYEMIVKVSTAKVAGSISQVHDILRIFLKDSAEIRRALSLGGRAFLRGCGCCAPLEMAYMLPAIGFMVYLLFQIWLVHKYNLSYVLLAYIFGALVFYFLLEVYVMRPLAYRMCARHEIRRMMHAKNTLDIPLYLFKLYAASEKLSDKKSICFQLPSTQPLTMPFSASSAMQWWAE